MNEISNNQCEYKENVGGLKEQLPEKEQSAVAADLAQNQAENNADSFGKFKSASALLNAYNNLEAQFTKRSQELKRLEKEIGELKAEQASKVENVAKVKADTVIAEDETGTGETAQFNQLASCESEDETIAREVSNFLQRNPSASKYAKAIALKTSQRGEVENGFLERAFIEVLQDEIENERNKITDDFIYSKVTNSPLIKERIVRDYLSGIIQSKGATLLSSGGESVIMPPKKPLTITQAGEMATEVLRKK